MIERTGIPKSQPDEDPMLFEHDETQPNLRIDQIKVVGLFGHLNYTIDAAPSDVSILYGDNGTGKTTILKLLYHTLSSEDDRGHRTFLAKVPFQQFIVSFAQGHIVEASRKDPVSGPFKMTVAVVGQQIVTHNFITSEGRVRNQEESTYGPLLDSLGKLSLGLFLLPENRNIESNLWEDGRSGKSRRSRDLELVFDEKSPTFDNFVEAAMTRAFTWIRRSVLSATNRGETDTSKIYFEIVKRLVERSAGRESLFSFEEIGSRLSALKSRSEQFTKFGLTPSFDTKEIGDLLVAASEDQRSGIVEVLTPYIKTFSARLDALETTRETLQTFERIFNEFYNHKRISIDIRGGIKFFQDHDNSGIAPENLSSGEKQLLLLFCNILIARSRPSLFIIDEPELSLNIKWQRSLIHELRNCVKDCNVQFFMATHSLEMISSSRMSTIKLEP